MSTFGELLHQYRDASHTPGRPAEPLTQEQLAERVSLASGANYSFRSISSWERDKNLPLRSNRKVLLALVKVLHQGGGITSPTQADALLWAGDYRSLDTVERQEIDPTWVETSSAPAEPTSVLKLFVARLDQWLMSWWSWREPAGGPNTSIIFEVMRRMFGGWTFPQTFNKLIWILIWIATWVLMWPMLQWPFPSDFEIRLALGGYALGGLFLPFLITWRVYKAEALGWKATHPHLASWTLTFFMHQGAALGFHLAYFMILSFAFVAHYLAIESVPRWWEFLVAGFPVFLAYATARQNPLNLLKAYNELSVNKAMLIPTIAFVLVVPAWLIFFFEYHDWLLDTVGGPALLITTLFLCVGWNARR